MKRKSLIAAVMVLVLLCASSTCVALAYGWCDHNCNCMYEMWYSVEGVEPCGDDVLCTVTVTYTFYDIWCPKCYANLGYAEEWTYEHTGADCASGSEYSEYWD